MITSLILAGASAEALSDPTSSSESHPAAAVAELYGHKGIAAYLSETRLINHPLASEDSTLTIYHKEAHTAGGTEDQLSIKDSLDGARNALQAATRIQQAFRSFSFRRKGENEKRYNRENSSYRMSLEEMYEIGSIVKSNKKGHVSRPDPVSEKAALSIQKNFRCWKNRKEFLHMKRNVVKIQVNFDYTCFLIFCSLVFEKWKKKKLSLSVPPCTGHQSFGVHLQLERMRFPGTGIFSECYHPKQITLDLLNLKRKVSARAWSALGYGPSSISSNKLGTCLITSKLEEDLHRPMDNW